LFSSGLVKFRGIVQGKKNSTDRKPVESKEAIQSFAQHKQPQQKASEEENRYRAGAKAHPRMRER
jgi:hypothetical protein